MMELHAINFNHNLLKIDSFSNFKLNMNKAIEMCAVPRDIQITLVSLGI